ncbi:hypothetical protein GC163_20640 [bacterium]|nr:hypothetical protein [bacterium]
MIWLLGQQGTDGGWHSQTYRTLEGGTGLSGLVMTTLSEIPEPWRSRCRPAFENSRDFLTRSLDQKGLVQTPDEAADFPIYATALFLQSLARRPEMATPELRQRLGQALLAQQRSKPNGWTAKDQDFGGWSWDSNHRSEWDENRPANIAVTACVLTALQSSQNLTPVARADALMFIERCQNSMAGAEDDGGFFFTPNRKHPLNKAGWFRTENGSVLARSYRSATCDGLRAQFVLSVEQDAPRREAAWKWLNQACSSSEFDSDPRLGTVRGGLDFYETAALAELTQQKHPDDVSRMRLLIQRRLLQRQQSDGSWSNSQPGMREDDPLIATAYAIVALARLQWPEETQ